MLTLTKVKKAEEGVDIHTYLPTYIMVLKLHHSNVQATLIDKNETKKSNEKVKTNVTKNH